MEEKGSADVFRRSVDYVDLVSQGTLSFLKDRELGRSKFIKPVVSKHFAFDYVLCGPEVLQTTFNSPFEIQTGLFFSNFEFQIVTVDHLTPYTPERFERLCQFFVNQNPNVCTLIYSRGEYAFDSEMYKLNYSSASCKQILQHMYDVNEIWDLYNRRSYLAKLNKSDVDSEQGEVRLWIVKGRNVARVVEESAFATRCTQLDMYYVNYRLYYKLQEGGVQDDENCVVPANYNPDMTPSAPGFEYILLRARGEMFGVKKVVYYGEYMNPREHVSAHMCHVELNCFLGRRSPHWYWKINYETRHQVQDIVLQRFLRLRRLPEVYLFETKKDTDVDDTVEAMVNEWVSKSTNTLLSTRFQTLEGVVVKLINKEKLLGRRERDEDADVNERRVRQLVGGRSPRKRNRRSSRSRRSRSRRSRSRGSRRRSRSRGSRRRSRSRRNKSRSRRSRSRRNKIRSRGSRRSRSRKSKSRSRGSRSVKRRNRSLKRPKCRSKSRRRNLRSRSLTRK